MRSKSNEVRPVRSGDSRPIGKDVASENDSGDTPSPVRRPAEGSFPPLATGTIPTSTMRAPTATTGLLPSLRTTRTTRGTSTSVPAMSTGTAATVTTGAQSVLSQNNRTARAVWPSRPDDCVCDQHQNIKSWAKPSARWCIPPARKRPKRAAFVLVSRKDVWVNVLILSRFHKKPFEKPPRLIVEVSVY